VDVAECSAGVPPAYEQEKTKAKRKAGETPALRSVAAFSDLYPRFPFHFSFA